VVAVTTRVIRAKFRIIMVRFRVRGTVEVTLGLVFGVRIRLLRTEYMIGLGLKLQFRLWLPSMLRVSLLH